jgi:hypothetical protein
MLSASDPHDLKSLGKLGLHLHIAYLGQTLNEVPVEVRTLQF